MTTSYARFSDLLRSMFDAAELRAFLRRLPQGQDLADALPEGKSIRLLAGDAVDVLQRRGRINQELFAELITYAPERYREIVDVASTWGITPLPPLAPTKHTPSNPSLRQHKVSSTHFREPVTITDGQTGTGAQIQLQQRLAPVEAGEEPSREIGKQPSSTGRHSKRTDVAILVALEEEFTQLLSLVPQTIPVRDADYGGYDYQFSAGPEGATYQCIARFIGNMGPERAGLFTDRLLSKWRPSTVVMIGIAAGMHADVRLGDVVVAEQVDAYLAETKAVAKDIDNWTLEPRPRVFPCDHILLQEVANLRFAHPTIFNAWRSAGVADIQTQMEASAKEQLASEGLFSEEPTVIRAHLASGPVVVTASAFAQWIRSHDASIKAVEMESSGMVESASTRMQSVRALVIRGISDLGDERKSKLDAIGKGGLRRLAMRNATRLLLSLLDAGVLPHGLGND